MGKIASQITSLTIVYSTVYSDADQIIYQSSASLAFVRGSHRGPVISPHKWPVMRKMFPFDDVIMVEIRMVQLGLSTRHSCLPNKKVHYDTEQPTSGGSYYRDVIMGAMASQITSLTIVCSTVCSGADQRKHQSSASLAFVRGIHRGPVNSPHKWPVTRKMFPFDDVIMVEIRMVQLGLSTRHFCLPYKKVHYDTEQRTSGGFHYITTWYFGHPMTFINPF